jgi:hypothetical protein
VERSHSGSSTERGHHAGEIDAFGQHHRLLANVNTPSEYGDSEAFQGHQL